MLDLRQITLWGCVFSTDAEYLARTIRVMRYCLRLARFDRAILFSYLPPKIDQGEQLILPIQIPNLSLDGFNIFANSIVPQFIESPYALAVHEDGTILEPEMWTESFYSVDYLGAPWRDGTVGNGGFALMSQKFLRALRDLPWSELLTKPFDGQNHIPSDAYACRIHRQILEKAGVKFAPRDLAMRFSTEQIGGNWPSFGWHGKRADPAKYRKAWRLIEASERGN